MPQGAAQSIPNTPARIILIRHGRPAIDTAPRTAHSGFRAYIDDYEEAGLDPASAPPEELQDLVKELTAVLTSGTARAHQSAKALAPNAELIADPLFVEAPLASPRIPLAAHDGAEMGGGVAHPVACGLSSRDRELPQAQSARGRGRRYPDARARAKDGQAALVAHGYFNLMIGRDLRRRGFTKSGSHRAHYWNAVMYETSQLSVQAATPHFEARAAGSHLRVTCLLLQ